LDLKVSSIEGVEIVSGSDIAKRLQLLDLQMSRVSSAI
jgi:hypothetical protein